MEALLGLIHFRWRTKQPNRKAYSCFKNRVLTLKIPKVEKSYLPWPGVLAVHASTEDQMVQYFIGGNFAFRNILGCFNELLSKYLDAGWV